jgi:hypothetical protein
MKNKHVVFIVLAMAALLLSPLAANADEAWNFLGPQAPFPAAPTSPAVAVGSGPVIVTNADGYEVTLTPYSVAPTDPGASNGTIGQLTGRNLGPGSDEQGAGVGSGPYLETDSNTFEVNGNEAIRIDFTDFANIPGADSEHLFFNSLTSNPGGPVETAHIWQDCVGCTNLGTIVHNPATFPAPEDFSIPPSAFGHPIFVTADAGDFLLYGVSVDTVSGCSLTYGYWKTHTIYGPARHADPTWNEIVPDGPDTSFFLSGQSYYQVLQTKPRRGNAYYILAHQYIAALLNQLSGASSTPAVDTALARAFTFFSTYTPSSTLPTAVRNQAISSADVLDQYNEGIIGPGACD